jgi:antitoxin component of MazEF toxin-antitoxin module
MSQLTIVSFGESAAVVLPRDVLQSLGVQIGDVLDATLGDQKLILRPPEDAGRRQKMAQITREVFEQRRDAYQRLA